MTYRLDKITLRLKNDDESLAKINEIFADIVLGKIPLVYTLKMNSLMELHLYQNTATMNAMKQGNLITASVQ